MTTALDIKRPWARLAIEAWDTAGGYFTVTNSGKESDRLVAASTPAAAKVEIHAIKVVGANIRMRPIESLVFYPGTTIDLKPRGYHLLLKGLKSTMTQGAKVPLTLTFEKAGNIAVEMTVEAPGLVGYEVLDVERFQRG